MKKSVAFIFLLLVGGFFFFLIKAEFSPFASKTLLGKDIKLYFYTSGDTLLGGGVISMPFRRSKNGKMWLNVAVDFNGDGKYSGYLAEGKTQEEWIAKNQKPRILADYRNNFSFAIVDKTIGNRSKFMVKAVLSDHKLRAVWTAFVLQDGEVIMMSVPPNRYDLGSSLGFDIPGADPELKRGLSANTIFQNFLPKFLPIRKASASSDSDFEVFREAYVPDLTQKPMECTPTAVADNIISLAGEHGRLTDLPEATRALIEELKTDMNFKSGVLNDNLVLGKDKFSARYKLPIATTRIYHPSFQDIVDALTSGAAVELSMKLVKSESGKASTGHLVSLVGAGSSDNSQYVYVHDPATPQGVDTLNLSFRIQSESGNTTSEGIEYPGWDGVAYIDVIFVQKWSNQPKILISTAQPQEIPSPSITKLPSPSPKPSPAPSSTSTQSPAPACDFNGFVVCRDKFNLQGCINACPLVPKACPEGASPDTECKETDEGCSKACWNKGNEHGSTCAEKNNCTFEDIDRALRS